MMKRGMSFEGEGLLESLSIGDGVGLEGTFVGGKFVFPLAIVWANFAPKSGMTVIYLAHSHFTKVDT